MPDKYTPITDPLYAYALAQRSNANDPVAALYADTFALGEAARLAVTPEQASLIGLLAATVNVKWAVEVGTFTGISSISIARVLAPNGKIFSFDQDFKYTSIARRYWIKAGVQDRIDLRLGDARRLLPHFRPRDPLDFVYIDADKESYEQYYEHLCPFVRAGGLILFDNTLRGGLVADPVGRTQPINRTMINFNQKLANDSRVQTVLLPMADGLTICRKLPAPGTEPRRGFDVRRMDNVRLK